MLNNIVYISYKKTEPLMNGLGMRVISINRKDDIPQLIKQLKMSKVVIAYISEAIYLDARDFVDGWSDPSLVITVLSPDNKGSKYGENRMQRLLENAIGIKKG